MFSETYFSQNFSKVKTCIIYLKIRTEYTIFMQIKKNPRGTL